MTKPALFLAFILVGLIQYSCKKDDSPLTQKEMLTGKTWIITSKALTPSVSLGGITIDDIIILDSDDQRNYTYKYAEDGTMIEYNKSGQEIFRSSWSFNGDETKITHNPGIVYTYPMVGDFSLNTITIVSITENKMKANVPYNFAGTDYMATFTYEPK